MNIKVLSPARPSPRRASSARRSRRARAARQAAPHIRHRAGCGLARVCVLLHGGCAGVRGCRVKDNTSLSSGCCAGRKLPFCLFTMPLHFRHHYSSPPHTPPPPACPWSSSTEPLLYCCGASSVYDTDEDGHGNASTSASIARVACPLARPPARRNLRFLWRRGPKTLKIFSPAAGN